MVLGHNICPECESKIVSLTRDDPDYEHFKSGLKKIWQRLGA
ncbi:MAG: sigma factor G inhibitor Gin [Eubacteriales bacterium]